ncbi:MAG TPA: amidohydrolase [Steroidobacteraceae bacterium]|nr:amidohydrolase [Steroidobacteraceae bacterium]
MNKRSVSRRAFVGFAGAGIATLIRSPAALAALQGEPRDPDLIVFNAKVYTVDAKRPKAEAFAVKAGRFIAVGSTEDIKSLAGKSTQSFDAQQMTIVPGFIDCHNHATGNMLLYDVLVGNPYEVEFVTISSIVEKLRARAQKTPAGFWVEGYFYDDTKVKDGRQINIHDLDQVSRQHPVGVEHRGGHTHFFNSKAFELAGVTRATPDPPGGTFDRGPDGELNGRVTDNALAAFEKVGKRPAFSEAERRQRDRDGLAHISKQFVRYGLTSVHHEEGDFAALQEIRARGQLLHRVSYEMDDGMLEAMLANGIETGFGDEWLRLGATSEHQVDGSFSERTMALSVPYPGSKSGYRGNLTETQATLDGWIERVWRAGIQPNCHANGDVAIDAVLRSLQRAQERFPRADVRPKITHCTLINDDLLKRMKVLGVVPTPFTSYAYYNSDKFHFYGEALMRHCMAYRSFIDSGITAAAGSDFPPGPFAPLMGIQGMVTRTGWNGETWGANQRVTVAEALQINTLNGAYASHEEKSKGSITPGKLADFVVLAEDLNTVPQDHIKDVKVFRTVTEGATVYQA